MSDIITLVIKFDEGTLDVEEAPAFAAGLITSGLVNSTGTYQRFVYWAVSEGLVNPDGTLTAHGEEVAGLGEEAF